MHVAFFWAKSWFKQLLLIFMSINKRNILKFSEESSSPIFCLKKCCCLMIVWINKCKIGDLGPGSFGFPLSSNPFHKRILGLRARVRLYT